MKTNLLHKSFFIVCALMFASFGSARAQQTNSTWVGQPGDNWSDASKWDPAIVPNNAGSQTFNVTANTGADSPGINLDLNVTVSSLTLAADGATTSIIDHNLSSAATDLGSFPDEEFGGGNILALAQSSNVFVNLGNLANFSDNTLTSGNYLSGADPGKTSTIRFNGADIRTNNADIQIAGPGAGLLDENGNDALRNIEHNLLNGQLAPALFGHNFTTAGSLVNEGDINIVTYSFDQNPDLPTTFTVTGDFTGIGFPDDGNLGFVGIEAPGADGKLLINGALTNYNAAHKTLSKTWYQWVAAGGNSATTQVLGGSNPLDIVTSQAALQLFGPNTGLRDKFGIDALRNLAVSARLLVGDRDFASVSSFTSTNRLSIYGGSNFTVNGYMTINAGRFEVSSESGYAHAGAGPAFPNFPPYEKSNITVRGNLNLMPGINCRFDIFDNATLSSVTIGGAAILNGVLQIRLLDGADISSSDTFTLLTAHKIHGQFSNVASGGRVTATSFSDGSELGTFLVTYGKISEKHRKERGRKNETLVLSDFQPSAP
jgi:hypothetical protein